MKILLCTDGSKNALAGVSLGGRLAAALGAETTLLAAGKNRSRVDQSLSEARQALAPFELTPNALEGIGPSVQQFAQHAQHGRYDLVVVGYRRRKGWEKALGGSVAAKVANKATTSVLIVRRGRPDIRKILVGIGGNGFTAEMARWSTLIATAVGAQVTLLHVDAAPPLMYAGLEEVHQTLVEFLETDTPAARALRQAAGTLSRAGVSAEIKLVHGVADRELLRTAQEGDYDLIVLGSAWAQPPISRVMLPNVTRAILLNTRRPVLVVFPADQPTSL